MDYRQNKKPDFDNNTFFRASNLCYFATFNRYTNPLSQKGRISGNFNAFKEYIELALDVARQKEASSAHYTVVDKNKEFSLSSWVRFTVKSKIANGKITSAGDSFYEQLKGLGINVEEIDVQTIHKNGSEIEPIVVDKTFYFEGDVNDNIVINNNNEIVVEKERYFPKNVKYGGQILPVINGKVSIESYKDNSCTDADFSSLVFSIKKAQVGLDSGNVVIQLEDNPNAEVSLYDTFFTDDATEVYFDKKKETYQIVKKDKEYGRLTLKISDKHIAPTGMVTLSVNINQLIKQRDAVIGLIKRPSDYQRPLLNLAESYDYLGGKGGLDNFDFRQYRISYKVLTDDKRDGVDKQRDFVMKALQTPDFMILQGPPGSGKTTAILELIYQLTKHGKRVLLCASTHVAIDNVLEKVITHQNSEELLKAIHPIRVGDEDNVYSDCVKPFIYDNAMRGIPEEYKDLVESSFNLVCGTTIGVLKYPPLAKMISESKSSTTKPLFDCMIIDEASKTTFSEFLVPAATAKKWIIVGDVKQLAPYVEKNDLKPTLMACSALDRDYKRIGLSLLREFSIPEFKKKYKNHVLILSREVIDYLDKAIDNSSNFVAVTNLNTRTFLSISGYDLDNQDAKVVTLSSLGNIVLVEESLANQVFPLLNNDYIVLNHKEDISSINCFEKYKVLRFRKMLISNEKRNYREEYSSYVKNRDVVNEILWRLIRLYELNDNQRKAFYYKNYLDSLKNAIKDEDQQHSFVRTLETLQGIAIPSIIMMLQEGIKSTSLKRQTRISGGLTEAEKLNRFVMLDYQHRMHPDISAISRKNVYNEEALKDYSRWESKINNYPSESKNRFEIRDIKSENPVSEKNYNKAEVRAIIDELLKFIEFAKTNKKPDGKRYEIAILSFYNHQVYALRNELQKIFGSGKLFNFYNDDIHVSLNSVDKFQGQEADVVYLSMVQNRKLGFLDSISRVNVAITRAKEKIIIFGDQNYFAHEQKDSDFLLDIFRRG